MNFNFGAGFAEGVRPPEAASGTQSSAGTEPRLSGLTSACAGTWFTAKERDAETGLDFFQARYYSAAQGRFTSPDEFLVGLSTQLRRSKLVSPVPCRMRTLPTLRRSTSTRTCGITRSGLLILMAMRMSRLWLALATADVCRH